MLSCFMMFSSTWNHEKCENARAFLVAWRLATKQWWWYIDLLSISHVFIVHDFSSTWNHEKCENARAINVARRLATSQFTRCLRSAKTLRREAPREGRKNLFFFVAWRLATVTMRDLKTKKRGFVFPREALRIWWYAEYFSISLG